MSLVPMESRRLTLVLILLLGCFPRGYWEMNMDIQTCMSVQLKAVWSSCSEQHPMKKSPKLWGECVVEEGKKICMQCYHILKLNIWNRFSLDISDPQISKFDKITESIMSSLLQEFVRCMLRDDVAFIECYAAGLYEIMMTHIGHIIDENFLDRDYMHCWLERTMNATKGCLEISAEMPAFERGNCTFRAVRN
ncbi:hypothetical protein GN956_G10380 [Arapaima gigas]